MEEEGHESKRKKKEKIGIKRNKRKGREREGHGGGGKRAVKKKEARKQGRSGDSKTEKVEERVSRAYCCSTRQLIVLVSCG